MIVTVINPDAPDDSPSYDGEPAAAHLHLAPGSYRCEYVDIDDNPLWGTLVVTDIESHLIAGGPSKPLSDLAVGDTISFGNDDRPWHEFNGARDAAFAEGTIETYAPRASDAPDADPEVDDIVDLGIRTNDGVLHVRWGWGMDALIYVPASAPAVVTETPAADATSTVIAEDAPIGVHLWPTVTPESAPNFTLATVETVRNANGSFVRWTYESGTTRVFKVGEAVVVQIAAESHKGQADKVIAAYHEEVVANTSPEWNALQMVAHDKDGMYGVQGEVLTVAERLGMPIQDDGFLDALYAATDVYQAKLRTEQHPAAH